MQVQSAPDLASRSHSGSDFSLFRPKEEANDFYLTETKVRCLCNGTMLNDNMIKVTFPKKNQLNSTKGVEQTSLIWFHADSH
jgi:hypothetical protein